MLVSILQTLIFLKTQSFVLSPRAKPVVEYVLSLQSLVFSNYYTVYLKKNWQIIIVFFNDGLKLKTKNHFKYEKKLKDYLNDTKLYTILYSN